MISLSLFSCNKKEEAADAKDGISTPKIPGTNLDDYGDVRSVFNVKICPNDIDGSADCPQATKEYYNKVVLNWSIPNLYRSEDWMVVIFKSKKPNDPYSCENPGPSALCEIVNPKSPAYVTYEVARLKDTTWVDTDISQNENYFYWIYLVLDGKDTPRDTSGYWSISARNETKALMQNSGSSLPTGLTFWRSLVRNTLVSAPNGGRNQFNTFDAGQATVGSPKGRIAISNNGIIAASDSNNNRVVIYDNQQFRTCLEYAEDDLSTYACMMSSSVQSISPVNILGQPDHRTNLSCQEHNTVCQSFLDESNCLLTRDDIPSFCRWNNQANTCSVKASDCLTNPTEVFIEGNKLFIADTGNDRVKLFRNILYTIPSIPDEKQIISCDGDLLPGISKPMYCTPDKVFGKKTINDLTPYSLQFEGVSALSKPSGIFTDEDDLYIADTGNNRIVKVSNYLDSNLHVCTPESWLSELCRWKGLLGQPNYNSKQSFKNIISINNSVLGGTFSNILQEGVSSPVVSGKLLFEGPSENLLKRYFQNPNKIKIAKINGEKILLVAAQEDFTNTTNLGTTVALRGRILKFPLSSLSDLTPKCNEATFSTASCEAADVIGQEKFEKLPVLSGSSGGAGVYRNLSYGIEYLDDFELIDDTVMLAVDATNNLVLQWFNIGEKDLDGYPFDSRIQNPRGEYIGNNQSLPDLKGIGGIGYDAPAGKLFVVDGAGNKIFILDFVQLNIE